MFGVHSLISDFSLDNGVYFSVQVISDTVDGFLSIHWSFHLDLHFAPIFYMRSSDNN